MNCWLGVDATACSCRSLRCWPPTIGAKAHLQAHPEDDKAPAVSCKRREVLRLPLDDYRRWADRRRTRAAARGSVPAQPPHLPLPGSAVRDAVGAPRGHLRMAGRAGGLVRFATAARAVVLVRRPRRDVRRRDGNTVRQSTWRIASRGSEDRCRRRRPAHGAGGAVPGRAAAHAAHAQQCGVQGAVRAPDEAGRPGLQDRPAD